MRHPLHIQNGNDESSIGLARLMLAIEAVDTNAALKAGDRSKAGEGAALGMEQWSAIVEARKAAEKMAQGEDKQIVGRLAELIDSVHLAKAYDPKTRRVNLTVQTWLDILKACEDAHGPHTVKAWATETFIRTGRFPGQQREAR